jgi:hypothetical protein
MQCFNYERLMRHFVNWVNTIQCGFPVSDDGLSMANLGERGQRTRVAD